MRAAGHGIVPLRSGEGDDRSAVIRSEILALTYSFFFVLFFIGAIAILVFSFPRKSPPKKQFLRAESPSRASPAQTTHDVADFGVFFFVFWRNENDRHLCNISLLYIVLRDYEILRSI